MYTIGMDLGSVASKGVLYNGEEIVAKSLYATGWSPKETAESILKDLCQQASIDKKKIDYVVGTGYGRVSIPFADDTITEISCHGRGAHFFNEDVHTVIDIGGQDSKIISINDKGQVVDFLMNDKCAAGTGRFLQVMSQALGVDVSDLSNLGEKGESVHVSSMCTVFAESEVVSLIGEGNKKEDIAHGLIESVANRVITMTGRIGIQEKIFFSGGLAQIPLLRDILNEKLDTEIVYNKLSQFLGAIGAAIIAYEKAQKKIK